MSKSQAPRHQTLKRLNEKVDSELRRDHVSMSKEMHSINRDTSEREVSWLS